MGPQNPEIRVRTKKMPAKSAKITTATNADSAGGMATVIIVQQKRTYKIDNIFFEKLSKNGGKQGLSGVLKKPTYNTYSATHTHINDSDDNLPVPLNSARPATPSLFGVAALRLADRFRSYSRMSGAGCARRAGRSFLPMSLRGAKRRSNPEKSQIQKTKYNAL
jgi:hypothetical protein